MYEASDIQLNTVPVGKCCGDHNKECSKVDGVMVLFS